MRLLELKLYIKNNFDREIMERMSKDSEENLNNYIVNVVCDLIKNIPMEESLLYTAKENINKSDENTIGRLSAYISLIPYVQLKLRDRKDVYIIASSLVEILISYIVGYVSEEDFNNKLLEIKQILEISDLFYNEIINYFKINANVIVDGINNKI